MINVFEKGLNWLNRYKLVLTCQFFTAVPVLKHLLFSSKIQCTALRFQCENWRWREYLGFCFTLRFHLLHLQFCKFSLITLRATSYLRLTLRTTQNPPNFAIMLSHYASSYFHNTIYLLINHIAYDKLINGDGENRTRVQNEDKQASTSVYVYYSRITKGNIKNLRQIKAFYKGNAKP